MRQKSRLYLLFCVARNRTFDGDELTLASPFLGAQTDRSSRFDDLTRAAASSILVALSTALIITLYASHMVLAQANESAPRGASQIVSSPTELHARTGNLPLPYDAVPAQPKWTRTGFPGGVSIELVGVAEAISSAANVPAREGEKHYLWRSWTPDGQPSVLPLLANSEPYHDRKGCGYTEQGGPGALPTRFQPSNHRLCRSLAFAFRIRPSVGQEADTAHFYWLESPDGSPEINNYLAKMDDITDKGGREQTAQALWRTGGFHILYATVPFTQNRINIKLEGASGPWNTVCRVAEPEKRGRFARRKVTLPDHSNIQMNVIAAGDVSATVLRAWDQPSVVLRLVAIGRDGVRHTCRSSNSDTVVNMASFTRVFASLAERSPMMGAIREMALEMRTYRKAEWKNVALRPSE